jgi:hypothetical protein
MPSEPTREELLAQVATLEGQLRALSVTAPLPFAEVSGVAPPTQPDKKTSQAVLPVAQTEQRIAVARALLQRSRLGKATPAEIQAQIDGLQTVIISGVNSAGYGDKRTEFRSLTELRQILNRLEEDLAEALGLGGRVRQIRMTTQADKGL